MELYYNPDLMAEDEIKATFVARELLLDELISLMDHQPDGAGVQHALIIAPRGMGKTTVLLMLRYAVNDERVSTEWQAIKFAEESYHIYDLADFWIEVLNRLGLQTSDASLSTKIEQLKTEFPNSADLGEAALATIKDWRRRHNKRLVVLVDNIDMILEQINDELENAKLRDVLMNDGSMMLIGTASTFFREATDYDKPLYNFFKIYNLDRLTPRQMGELLLRRAEVDGISGFEDLLKSKGSRLRALEYFTGGNPRLVLMLYHVVTKSDISEVRSALEKLLDEVTPYYKAKVENLPPQLRKILDHIARVSSQTSEGVTPTEIGQITRLAPNQVSAQLKRLSSLGYVNSVNLRGRSSYYVLSEPLYAVWHQMRFGRDARKRMQWLVDILKSLYDVEELDTQNRLLGDRFREELNAGHVHEAKGLLENRLCLTEAMADLPTRFSAFDEIVRGYLELKDTKTIREELLSSFDIANLSANTLTSLKSVGCISEEDYVRAKDLQQLPENAQEQAQSMAAYELGQAAFSEANYLRALDYFRDALSITPELVSAMRMEARTLEKLERKEEALLSVDRALQIDPKDVVALTIHGNLLGSLAREQEAVSSFDQALALKPKSTTLWRNRGLALTKLRRHREAIASFDKSIEIDPNNAELWTLRGDSNREVGNVEEALSSYDRAIELNPQSHNAWKYRATLFQRQKKDDEAIDNFERALEFGPDCVDSWIGKGISLGRLNRPNEALDSFQKASELSPDNSWALYYQALALRDLGRTKEALGKLDRALNVNPTLTRARLSRGQLLTKVGKLEEALKDFDRGLEQKPDHHELWKLRGMNLKRLGQTQEAIESFDRALALEKGCTECWSERGLALVNLGNYEEAMSDFDHLLTLVSEGNWNLKVLTILLKFTTRVRQGRLDLAKEEWRTAMKALANVEQAKWPKFLSKVLFEVAEAENLDFINQLINESGLKDALFPLRRAIDFTLTNNEELIEKLSPEVRGVVEEIVRRIQKMGSTPKQRPRLAATSKSKPRRRIAKQLT